MNKLIDTPVDQRNIGLAKLLYELRQDLDIYCMVSVNAEKINGKGIGKSFFGRLQQLVLTSIALNICKVFEEEKGYELNSIRGVINYLTINDSKTLNDNELRYFIRKYQGPSNFESSISVLQSTVDEFQKKYKDKLEQFKAFRDKKVAHSEYDVSFNKLPSYECMENLFYFGVEFYNLISVAFIGVVPYDLMTGRKVKVSLKKLLQEIGLETIEENME